MKGDTSLSDQHRLRMLQLARELKQATQALDNARLGPESELRRRFNESMRKVREVQIAAEAWLDALETAAHTAGK